MFEFVYIPERLWFIWTVEMRMDKHLQEIPPAEDLLFLSVETGAVPNRTYDILWLEFRLFVLREIEKLPGGFEHALYQLLWYAVIYYLPNYKTYMTQIYYSITFISFVLFINMIGIK